MTGEELVQSLLERVSAKRARVGELTLTLGTLEQLLRESLVPLPQRPEPGYPKRMSKAQINAMPWVPKGPEPPLRTWVNNKKEEGEAFANGFREEGL
jgi:hypothetical protein